MSITKPFTFLRERTYCIDYGLMIPDRGPDSISKRIWTDKVPASFSSQTSWAVRLKFNSNAQS
jgi:hypothetical protein